MNRSLWFRFRAMLLIFALLIVSAPLLMLALLSWLSRPPTNLGVQNGSLADCPSTPNCVSSRGENPDQHLAPWPFCGSRAETWQRLQAAIAQEPRLRIVSAEESSGYLRCEATSRWFRFVDDLEFLLDEGRSEVHFRSASRAGYSDLGVNRQRLERLRRAYGS